MVKSMFAGVAGLRTHQAKMDIIGNNIANVNTWGYKAASMSFKDTMYQNTSSGSAGNTDTGGYGGTNANQIGYGVTTGSVSYDFTKGGMSPSSRALDCMIDGSGFFIVGPMLSGKSLDLSSDNAIKSSGLSLSRVGQFKVDNDGYLVDDGGNYIYGFANKPDGDDYTTGKFATDLLEPLKVPTNGDLNNMNSGKSTNQVSAAQAALEKAQADLNTKTGLLGQLRADYIGKTAAYNAVYGAEAKNTHATDPTKDVIYGKIDDLSKALKNQKSTMEEAYKAWQNDATGASANVNAKAYYEAKLAYDETNYKLTAAQAFINKTDPLADKTKLQDALDALDTAFGAYRSALNLAISKTDVNDMNETQKDELKAVTDAMNKLAGIDPGSLKGQMDAADQAKQAGEKAVDTAANVVSNAVTNLKAAQDAATDVATEASDKGTDEIAELTNFKIQEDGTLVGTAGDVTIIIGKVALAGVQNTDGLEKSSGYYYSVGPNAGNVSVYEAGGTEGIIRGNYLEMATVDLSTEMTNMITTQRGFQANSKIITVTDQMLEELVNMKR